MSPGKIPKENFGQNNAFKYVALANGRIIAETEVYLSKDKSGFVPEEYFAQGGSLDKVIEPYKKGYRIPHDIQLLEEFVFQQMLAKLLNDGWEPLEGSIKYLRREILR